MVPHVSGAQAIIDDAAVIAGLLSLPADIFAAGYRLGAIHFGTLGIVIGYILGQMVGRRK